MERDGGRRAVRAQRRIICRFNSSRNPAKRPGDGLGFRGENIVLLFARMAGCGVNALRNDWLTVAALGLLAMCVVTVDHEALGHGSVCLLVQGRIVLLTSSLFRCSARSGWIDAGGPAMNLLMGTLALMLRMWLPRSFPKLRLFLICVTAFSFFWEGGYLIRAMHRQNGDLYFFARFLLGRVTLWQRWLGAAAGLALFVLSARIASQALLDIWPDPTVARGVARTVWAAAAIGAAVAAALYVGHDWGNFRDAVLEIAVASFPLLIVPIGRGASRLSTQYIARSYPLIALSLIVYAAFAATLGRGVIS
jgi:hypothetical protein